MKPRTYSCGEGGALLINQPAYIDRAEVLREKGTDRNRFFRGQVRQVHLDRCGVQLPAVGHTCRFLVCAIRSQRAHSAASSPRMAVLFRSLAGVGARPPRSIARGSGLLRAAVPHVLHPATVPGGSPGVDRSPFDPRHRTAFSTICPCTSLRWDSGLVAGIARSRRTSATGCSACRFTTTSMSASKRR